MCAPPSYIRIYTPCIALQRTIEATVLQRIFQVDHPRHAARERHQPGLSRNLCSILVIDFLPGIGLLISSVLRRNESENLNLRRQTPIFTVVIGNILLKLCRMGN